MTEGGHRPIPAAGGRVSADVALINALHLNRVTVFVCFFFIYLNAAFQYPPLPAEAQLIQFGPSCPSPVHLIRMVNVTNHSSTWTDTQR